MFGDNSKSKASVAISDEAIANLVEESKSMILEGKVDASIDHLLPIFKTRPDHTEANALVGAILLSIHRFELAEQFLYSAVNTSNWKNSGAVANLAQVFMRTDAIPLAAQTLRKGLDAVSNNDETGALSLCFGDVTYAAGNYSEAADWYLLAALKRPTNIDIWVKASTVRYPPSGRNLKLAENVLVQALAMNRESSDLLFNLGLAMHGSGRLNEAITFYQEAQRTNPANHEITAALATALHASGQFSQALAQYVAAEAAEPSTSPVFLANYALLLNSLGRKQEGRTLAMRALNADPNNADAIRAMRECTAE